MKIDIEILQQIGRLPIVHGGYNFINWLTAEWLFNTFFSNTEVVFHSEELAAQWREKIGESNHVKSPLLYFPDADLFCICGGGSVDHCPISNAGEQVGLYHFHNGCLFHFEIYGMRIDLDLLETEYVRLYNQKMGTDYMTQRQYRNHLEAKYGSSNPYSDMSHVA